MRLALYSHRYSTICGTVGSGSTCRTVEDSSQAIHVHRLGFSFSRVITIVLELHRIHKSGVNQWLLYERDVVPVNAANGSIGGMTTSMV